MYELINPIYAFMIGSALFALLLLFVVIAKGDEMYCTNPFTKWIYKTFSPIKGSVLFWNGLFWILFISTGVVWPELALGISIILSIMFFATSLDESDFENQTWQWASILIYVLIIGLGIGLSIAWFYRNTIGRFNNFLDKRNRASNN
jgi:hypothetical protein